MKKNWNRIIVLTYIFLLPVFALYADTSGTAGCGDGKICNPLSSTTTLPDLIKSILEGALKIGLPLIALAIIYCGFLFVQARGKPEELKKAKDALLYTIIGAAILLGSWAIAQMITNTVTAL